MERQIKHFPCRSSQVLEVEISFIQGIFFSETSPSLCLLLTNLIKVVNQQIYISKDSQSETSKLPFWG